MQSLGKVIFSVALVLVLLGSSPYQLNSHAQSSNSPACPANQTLRYTVAGGTPNTENYLAATNDGAFSTDDMMNIVGMSPWYSDSGAPDWNLSATDWINSNANYTQWTFNIKPGLKWSDGTSVTSADILGTFSSKMAFDPAYDSDGAHAIVTSINALNSSAATFTLNKADAWFPVLVGSALENGLFPPSFYNVGANYTGFNSIDPSLSPWYAANYSVGQTTQTFYKNPHFGPSAGPCALFVNYVESPSDSPTYLISGQSDLAQIESPSAAAILQVPYLHIYEAKYHIVEGLSYNITVYPYNMTAFRQALVYLINQSSLASDFSGYYQTAYNSEGGVPPVDAQIYNTNQQTYSYNTTKAMQLLGSIGIKTGSDGFVQYPNGTDITLNLWADDSFSENIIAANDIQGQLSSLGFKVDVHTTTYATLASYWSSNVFGVTDALILHPSDGYLYAIPTSNALAGWGLSAPSFEFNMPTWEWPPSVQAEFLSNQTAFDSTSSLTNGTQYLKNVQTINAQNLPMVFLGFPDSLWAYSTQHFTNWPTSEFNFYGHSLNITQLAMLQPVNSSTSGSSTTSAGGSTTTGTTQLPTTTQSTSSSSQSSSLSVSPIGVLAVIGIVLAMVLTIAVRRRSI